MEAITQPSSPGHTAQLIIYLAATGVKNPEIAEQLNLTVNYVNSVLKEERSLFELRKLRHQLYGKDLKKRFHDLIPAATDVIEQTMLNPNVKPHLKFTAAQEVLDRALGKPKQTVEVEGSMIRSVFEALDSKGEAPLIDVTPDIEGGGSLKQYVINPNEQMEVDSIDKWAKENL